MDLLGDLVWVTLRALVAAGEVGTRVVLFLIDLFNDSVAVIGLGLSVLEEAVVGMDVRVRGSSRDLLLNF